MLIIQLKLPKIKLNVEDSSWFLAAIEHHKIQLL